MTRTLILLTVLGLIVGCGQSGPASRDDVAPPEAPDGASTAAPPAPEAPEAQKAGGYKIAVVPKGLVHQFWLTVKAGAEAAAGEYGAEIVWNGPPKETEVATQIEILEDMITSGVDAIVMAACHETALIDVLQRAAGKGIPIVTIDSGVKSDIPVTFVATDNLAGAKAAAHALAELVGEQGKVGVIPFVPGAATSELREKGFLEGIAEFPNITALEPLYSQSDVAKGMAVTEDMMTAHADLKGIFAANEASAIGAAQALEAAGKAGAIKLVAFDAPDEEIQALKKGTIQALIVQNPFQMGYQGVKAAIDHIEGRPVEKRIDTGVTVVTMDNFNEPDVQKLLYPLK
ncbi:MAG: ABC transporter substrate-binding protein [Candidatus Hydrogenedentes bacterium]|nr:ABC transporter substrate-binding protein [Candidatus Hydrogenedentota bacterium]